MVTFFVCLVLLIVGFFTYSKLVEKIFRIDDRPTPAVAHPDGVDYVPMKTWRIFLVQLLNIAGLGPIYGALSGACWGPVVYLWIVFGTILGGGVHDFLSGMMSERNDGKSISEVVGLYMGKVITFIMRVFSVVLLVMVGVNFSVGPAGLLAKLTPDMLGTMFWLVVIMVYYLIATFLPIDKIIGKLYPVFGICLIIMALGIGGAIVLTRGSDMPELTAAAFTVVHPDSTAQVGHDVRHRGLRRHLRLPRHPVPHDGPLHHQREAGPHRLLRRHGGRGRHRPDLGRRRCHLLHQPRLPAGRHDRPDRRHRRRRRRATWCTRSPPPCWALWAACWP